MHIKLSNGLIHLFQLLPFDKFIALKWQPILKLHCPIWKIWLHVHKPLLMAWSFSKKFGQKFLSSQKFRHIWIHITNLLPHFLHITGKSWTNNVQIHFEHFTHDIYNLLLNIWRWLFQQRTVVADNHFFYSPKANMRFLAMIFGGKRL